jgi:predicted AAA+ superfamily ATPase
MMPELFQRHLAPVVEELMRDEPVVVVNGARAVGKSTTLRAVASTRAAPVFDLDEITMRRLAESDPTLIADADPPVLVDEFQHVPLLLDAIKAQLNTGLRPGRYVLTGSTRYLSTPALSQSLAGRVAMVTLWPLSQGELAGRTENFLDMLLARPAAMVSATPSQTSRSGYRDRILAGGYPIALQRSGRSRTRWFANYLATIVERDVLEIRNIRQRELLPQILRRLASQTAGLLNISAVARDVGVDDSTAGDYVKLLDTVLLTHRLPAWGRTLGARVGALPKVHVIDTGLAAHLLGITAERLSSADAAALAEYGHVVETFGVNEILKQAEWAESAVSFGHYRTRDGSEVDLVAEAQDGRVAGVEVKAGNTVSGADLRGLRELRDKLGDRYVGGVALYTGSRSYTYEAKIHVLPLDSIWQRW